MFTIIIPTNERHHLLRRAIDYYGNFNCNILIIDSSANKADYKFPDNFRYRHRPGVSFAKRILEAAETVTTPYVCICSDDDFLLESSLQVGASFLDDNLDFVSVQGRYMQFELIENQVTFRPRYGKQHSNHAVIDEDILSRINRAYNPYMFQMVSMHRTDLLVTSFRLCADILINFWVELLTVLVPMCYGKHKVLPILWMVRDAYDFYRPNAYSKQSPEKSRQGLIFDSYKNHNHLIDEVKSFLEAQVCQSVKKKFASSISDLVDSEKESDKIFNTAFKSFIRGITTNRTKTIVKLILKSAIPAPILDYYAMKNQPRITVNVEADSSTKDTLDKIKLLVLSFKECYDTDIKKSF